MANRERLLVKKNKSGSLTDLNLIKVDLVQEKPYQSGPVPREVEGREGGQVVKAGGSKAVGDHHHHDCDHHHHRDHQHDDDHDHLVREQEEMLREVREENLEKARSSSLTCSSKSW